MGEMTPKRRIALVGRMGSGKTHVATRLANQHGYVRVAFADPLKQEAAALLSAFSAKHGHGPVGLHEIAEHKDVFRPFLQWFGTDFVREYLRDDGHWIGAFDAHLATVASDQSRVVVDDARFPNEVDHLRRRGFAVVRLLRNEAERMAFLRLRLTRSLRDESGMDAYEPLPESMEREVERRLREVQQHPSEAFADGLAVDDQFLALDETDLDGIADDLAVGTLPVGDGVPWEVYDILYGPSPLTTEQRLAAARQRLEAVL